MKTMSSDKKSTLQNFNNKLSHKKSSVNKLVALDKSKFSSSAKMKPPSSGKQSAKPKKIIFSKQVTPESLGETVPYFHPKKNLEIMEIAKENLRGLSNEIEALDRKASQITTFNFFKHKNDLQNLSVLQNENLLQKEELLRLKGQLNQTQEKETLLQKENEKLQSQLRIQRAELDQTQSEFNQLRLKCLKEEENSVKKQKAVGFLKKELYHLKSKVLDMELDRNKQKQEREQFEQMQKRYMEEIAQLTSQSSEYKQKYLGMNEQNLKLNFLVEELKRHLGTLNQRSAETVKILLN